VQHQRRWTHLSADLYKHVYQVAFAKVYDRKTALVAADLLNDRVLPFFEEQGLPLLRILTGRGTEYKGKREHHEYELYLDIEGIEHSKIQVGSPSPMASVSGFTEPFRKSFTRLLLERSCMNHWSSYNMILMNG
jgi:hypothetical protein